MAAITYVCYCDRYDPINPFEPSGYTNDNWLIRFFLSRSSGAITRQHFYQTSPDSAYTEEDYHLDIVDVRYDDGTGIVSSGGILAGGNPLYGSQSGEGLAAVDFLFFPDGYLDSMGFNTPSDEVLHYFDYGSGTVQTMGVGNQFLLFTGFFASTTHGPTDQFILWYPWYSYSPLTDTPPSGITTVKERKRLIVPVMDADSVTGRVSLALGMVDYEQLWSVGDAAPKSSGLSVASLAGLGAVTGHPVIFATSSKGAGELPWTKGADCGAAASRTGGFLLPQAMFLLPQEGKTRLLLQDALIPPSSAGGGMVSTHQWRETVDNGAFWSDVSLASGTPFPYAAFFVEGTQRSHRRAAGSLSALPALPIPAAGSIADIRPMLAGGPGFVYSRGEWRGVNGLPPYAAHGASSGLGVYASVSRSALSARTFASVSSSDGARSWLRSTNAPPVGGFSSGYLSVPGYPFPPVAETALFGPVDGMPAQTVGSPFCCAGGAAWARGSDQAGTIYLFQPFICRRPIPADSFSFDGTTLTGAFKKSSDAETLNTGRDWGTKTGIGWTWTGDGGVSWGPLGCVTASGVPLLADCETVRIAAARVSGGRILLCVCSEGVTTLYASDNGAQDFAALGNSTDGGLTWSTGAYTA